MTADLRDIWVYLSASPLLHLTLTLIAYQAGSWVYRRGKLNPLLNPVLLAVVPDRERATGHGRSVRNRPGHDRGDRAIESEPGP
jgi:hypothetical protein